MQEPILKEFIERNKDLQKKVKGLYLFGSRARGDERPDSDYDLLLVVTEDFSLSDKDKLYDRVMDLLLETGRLVSLKIFKESQFARLRKLETPFIQNVLQEGIKLG